VDLNSISMATTRLHERVGRKDIVLAFDSLTSTYLFSGAEVTKFMRLFLSRFAPDGNSVPILSFITSYTIHLRDSQDGRRVFS
jgi:hypothetical protein